MHPRTSDENPLNLSARQAVGTYQWTERTLYPLQFRIAETRIYGHEGCAHGRFPTTTTARVRPTIQTSRLPGDSSGLPEPVDHSPRAGRLDCCRRSQAPTCTPGFPGLPC